MQKQLTEHACVVSCSLLIGFLLTLTHEKVRLYRRKFWHRKRRTTTILITSELLIFLFLLYLSLYVWNSKRINFSNSEAFILLLLGLIPGPFLLYLIRFYLIICATRKITPRVLLTSMAGVNSAARPVTFFLARPGCSANGGIKNKTATNSSKNCLKSCWSVDGLLMEVAGI